MNITKNESQFNMIDWWKKVLFNNYVNFEGRARRLEFWYFNLFNCIILLPIYALLIFFMESENEIFDMFFSGIYLIFCLLLFLPSLAVSVRRLHDTGKSGWYLLLSFVPLIGLILLVFYFTDSDKTENEYGPNPKLISENEINSIGKE